MVAVIAVLALIFIIGMIFGSFLNVVILRTINEESIVFPPSKCPKCQTPLKWYHNIPVFSYLFLKGRCAFCNEKISIQYPLVELLTGLLFLGVSVFYFYSSIEWGFLDGFNFNNISFWLYTIMVSCLYVVIAGTDIKSLVVYELHTYIIMGLSLVFALIQSVHTGSWMILFYSFAGGLIFFLFVLGLKIFFDKLLKTEALGDGDPFIAGAIGSVIGAILPVGTTFGLLILTICAVFLLAPLLYAVWTVPVYLYNLYKQKNYYLMTVMLLFFGYVITYVFANAVGWLSNDIARISSFSVAAALGLWVCVEILKGLRKNQSSMCAQIPFGPALVLSAFIMMLIIPALSLFLS